MKIISCVFFKSYYYFIAFWILELLDKLERDYFESNYDDDKNSSNTTNITNNTNSSNTSSKKLNNGREIDLLYIGLLTIADMSAGFLVAYTFIRMNHFKGKKQEPSKAIDKPSYDLIYNDPSIKRNKYSLILLTSILNVLARGYELFYFLFVDLYRLDFLKTIWAVSIDILSRILFSYFILKIKIYKHHIISIIIVSIGFLINGYFGMNGLGSKSDWLYLLFQIISKILFALEDTISKILLTNKFLLAHYLMFLRGFFSFIIILFLFLVLYLTSAIDTNYYIQIKEHDDFGIEALRKIILVIFSFFKMFCIYRIIYIFSPQYVGFCNIILCAIEIIKYLIDNKDINDGIHFTFDIISLIFIFLGTLIFNEMIIINAFGLNENTKVGKIKKEALDNVQLKTSIISNEHENGDEMNNENEDNENINEKVEMENEYKKITEINDNNSYSLK